jgi:hypothetical protein
MMTTSSTSGRARIQDPCVDVVAGHGEVASPTALQDEATRPWTLHTALYYKAGGVPWRPQQRAAQLDSLLFGVAFLRTNDRTRVHSSVNRLASCVRSVAARIRDPWWPRMHRVARRVIDGGTETNLGGQSCGVEHTPGSDGLAGH